MHRIEKIYYLMRKEIAGLLLSPLGIIVTLLYLGLNSWFFLSPFFLAGRADMLDFFTLQPLYFALILPAVTMGLLAGESRSGHLEILQTLPVSPGQILMGKYLSALCTGGLLLVPTLAYPLSISLMGNLDGGPVFSAYLGLLLQISLFAAAGIFFSSLTSRQLTAFLGTLGICLILLLADDMGAFLSGGLSEALSRLGSDSHYLPFTRGLITLQDSLYFILASMVLLMVSREILNKTDRPLFPALRIALYAAALLLLILVVKPYSPQWDTTSRKTHTLSDETRRVLSDLEEPMTVQIYLSRDLPGAYSALRGTVTTLMERYRTRGKGKFQYQVHLLSGTEGEVQEQARAYGITPLSLQGIEEDEMTLISAWAGMVLLQGARQAVLPALDPEENLEYSITEAMEKLTRQSGQLIRLPENITIDVEISESLLAWNETLEYYPRLIRQTVEELNPAFLDRLEFSSRTVPSASLMARLTVKGNGRSYTRDLISLEGEELNLLSPQEISDLIRQIISLLLGTEKTLGYLTDHGTLPLFGDGGVSNFSRLVSQGYEIRPVTLNTLPDTLTALIINSPSLRFSAAEQGVLNQYVRQGGSLAIFLSSHYEHYPTEEELQEGKLPEYTREQTGLKEFLAGYGMGIQEGYVLDTDSYTEVFQEDDGNYTEIPVYYAPLISGSNINRDVEELEPLKEFLALHISPLRLLNSDDPSITPLFSSSASAWLMDENINLYDPMSIIPPSGESRQRFLLGALARPENTQGMILLTGSGRFLEDSLIDPRGRTDNAVFILNMMDMLAGETGRAQLRSKGMGYTSLNETSPSARQIFRVFNVYLLPLMTILLILAGMKQKKNRLKKIESSFRQEKQP